MTRTLFIVFCISLVLFTGTAFLIRAELAYAGVSPLFQNAQGQPDAQYFNSVVTLHRIMGYLSVILLGTIMANAARIGGAPLARIVMALGLLTSLAIGGVVMMASIQITSPSDHSVGWKLYPTLSTGPSSLLDHAVLSLGGNNLFFLIQMVKLLPLLAAASLYWGAYLMLSTLPKMRETAYIGFALTVITCLFVAQELLDTGVISMATPFLVLSIPLLVLCAIQMYFTRKPWLGMLAFGALVTSIGQWLLMGLRDVGYLVGTSVEVASQYTFPLGLAWFALPAVILFHTPTRLPRFAELFLAGTIVAAFWKWAGPLVTLGIQGLPTGYFDYPDAFADKQWDVTAYGLIFAATYAVILLTLLWMRKSD